MDIGDIRKEQVTEKFKWTSYTNF